MAESPSQLRTELKICPTRFQNLVNWDSSSSALAVCTALEADLGLAAALAVALDEEGFLLLALLLRTLKLPPPVLSSLKKLMVCCNCSAWLLISSEVAASSSELLAFCWVVVLSW